MWAKDIYWEARQNQQLPAKDKCSICGKQNNTNKAFSKHKEKCHKEKTTDGARGVAVAYSHQKPR